MGLWMSKKRAPPTPIVEDDKELATLVAAHLDALCKSAMKKAGGDVTMANKLIEESLQRAIAKRGIGVA